MQCRQLISIDVYAILLQKSPSYRQQKLKINEQCDIMTLILSWTTPFVNGESGASLFPRVDYRFDMFRGGAPYFLLCAKPIAILSYNKFLPRSQFIYPLITTNTLVHNYRLSLETVSLQFRWCVQSKLTVINYYSCYAPKRRDVCISAIKAAH